MTVKLYIFLDLSEELPHETNGKPYTRKNMFCWNKRYFPFGEWTNLFISAPFLLHILLYRRKGSYNGVNIFHKNICYLTTLLSARCKTYCFALQKRLFYTVKA